MEEGSNTDGMRPNARGGQLDARNVRWNETYQVNVLVPAHQAGPNPDHQHFAVRCHDGAERVREGEDPVEVRYEKVPVLGWDPPPGCVLVEVMAAALSHTDLKLVDGTLQAKKATTATMAGPATEAEATAEAWAKAAVASSAGAVTPGHHVAGVVRRVASTGLSVSDAAPLVGERVVIHPFVGGRGSGGYEQSDLPLPAGGPALRAEIGVTADGGLAKYVCCPWRSAVPLPWSLESFEEAAPAAGGAFAAAVRAYKRAGGLDRPESVAVFGCGNDGVGHALVQLARNQNCARVIAVASEEAHRAKARELGATTVIDGTDAVRKERREKGGRESQPMPRARPIIAEAMNGGRATCPLNQSPF